MPFSAPQDSEYYIEQILQRCRHLISSGIWGGVTHIRLNTWVKNFSDELERYFAACVLDALIFRCEGQTVALMEQLSQRTIPDLLRREFPDEEGEQPWFDQLRLGTYGNNPTLRIVPVIRHFDSPAKSGPVLARMYRRHLSLNGDWMIWPWLIKFYRDQGVRTFLFIDDFLGTGDQFKIFADQFELADTLKDCQCIYAPLVAHTTGIDAVKRHISHMHVVAVETIDDGYNLFSSESECFKDGINSPHDACEFYDALVQRFKFPLEEKNLRGYGKLSVAYAFHHATPDNCLPILWSEAENWKPLLDR